MTRTSDSTTPMSLADLWSAAGLPPHAAASTCLVPVLAIADDSRAVRPGSLFAAIRGAKVDGHRYVDAAARAGAAVILVDGDTPAPPGSLVVRVPDTRIALARIAAAFHSLRGGSSRGLKLIGVTGTNGKTTVAWMLRSVIRASGGTAAMLGTVEYDLVSERRKASLTTPGSLELCEALATARNAGATHAVMETSSHALDQHRCDGLNFTAGVFTNLTGEHLDYHRTMAAYCAAKRRLFESLDANAVAVINADDPSAEQVTARCAARVLRFGTYAAKVDMRVRVEVRTRRGQRVVFALGDDEPMAFHLPLVGGHNAMNGAAAALTANALGVERGAILTGLERTTRVPGRLQRVEPDGCPFTVLVDYAHTDDALQNVLQAVRSFTQGRVLCVFGCGGDRDRGKRPRMGAVVARFADLAFVTSDNPRTEDPDAIIDEILAGFSASRACPVRRQVDRRLAIAEAIGEARSGDTVLIAGKGHEDYQLFNGHSVPFDDAEVARSFLVDAGAVERVA